MLLILAPVSVSAHGFKLLVFTETAGFVHGSIPAGITAINQLAVEHDFDVTQTNDSAVLISQLATHDVVLFLNTTGDVFNATEEAAFKAWYQNGGGYVGIHAATDTEKDWQWYTDMVGAKFANHPAVQVGTVDFLDQAHPITSVIDPATNQRVIEWTVSEEWYNFTASPRGNVHVLAHLNAAIVSENIEEPDRPGVTGTTHGNDHPIMWCHEFDGGYSAYLGPGHANATYSDPIFRGLMINAIEWAAGLSQGDSEATIDANYEKIVLDPTVSNPMSIDIDSTGKVYLLERKGAVKVHDQVTGQTRVIGNLNAHSGGEYGLLGITLAPDFNTSRQLYILWSPSSGNNNRLSRFTLDGSGDLDPASEVSILEYFTNRSAGHHQAGSIAFAPDGNLVMSLGDNTWASQFSPRNDTSIANDARKGAPNSNDLRGGIVRIRPNVGAGPPAHPNYTIPSGNLFPPGTSLGRPEIYTKGARNCFRLCVDPYTGWVYYGDVGPDRRDPSTTNPFEGTRGHDEFNQVKGPGWFGWPYFLGNNKAYTDGAGNPWTMASMRVDLAAYFTTSTFLSNGGQAGNPNLLPDPTPAWIWYADGSTNAPPQFSELGAGGGRCAMAGAVYAHATGKNFPRYYDRSVFIMEWSRNRIFDVRTRPDGSILEITRFAPHLAFDRPLEMKFGPDGAMYVIEWGTEFGSANSTGAKLVKIQYTQGAATPIAVASSNIGSGSLPLTVNFSSAGTIDPDGQALTYGWDFNGDQITDSTAPNPTHTFITAGTYNVQLTVTDEDQLTARANLTINAGNNAPVLGFDYPANFSFFDWGDRVNFSFWVTDVEDGSTASGSIPASSVLLEGSLGHDDHQHNEIQLNSLTGGVTVPRDAAHGFDEDLGYVLDAFYTDQGAPGVQSIQGTAKVVLQPKVTQAQTRDGQFGTTTTSTMDPVGGVLDITSIDHGDFIHFNGLSLNGIQSIHFRASAQGLGGNIEVRNGSPTGSLIGTATVTDTGGAYRDFTVGSLQNVPLGSTDLYFVFTRSSGAGDLFRLNWINFRGVGATSVPDRPRLTNVAMTAPNTVLLEFNQAMDLVSLESMGNYGIDKGATITSVAPLPDQSGVMLTLSGLSQADYHTLNLTGLLDLAGDGIASGTRATFLNLPSSPPQFVIGLNAGGPNFTDSAGNLYIADTTPVGIPAPVSVLVDFAPNATTVPANAGHFIVGDSKIDPLAVVNVVTAANPTSPIALTGTNISGVTFTNTGANGLFATNTGFINNVQVLDAYLFESSVGGSTTTIAGLGGIPAGTPITLTLWGTGDTVNSDTRYTVNYNGAAVGTADTDYDAIGTPPNTSVARVQFTFNKVAAVDSVTIVWGKVSSATTTAGFGGFSLTAPNGPNSTTGSYFNRGSTFSTANPISNTTDDVIYQTERWSSDAAGFGYSIPVPNGDYRVLLRFAEINFGSAGSRIFNARIEGGSNLFTPHLDVFAASGGQFRAFDHTVQTVAVNDGILNVDLLKGSANNPKVSAIGVFRDSGTTSIPDPSFANFLIQQPGANFNPASDIDRDGLTALLEYALGGSESGQDAALLPQLFKLPAGDMEFVFGRPENLPDLIYTLEASNDLDEWFPIMPVSLINPLANGTEEVRLRGLRSAAVTAGLNDQPSVYFRLSVALSPVSP
jgi:cytochrome c